jgi:hypothetical protein
MPDVPFEDVQPDEAGSQPVTGENAPKSRPAFSRLTKELTDDDLDTPGARKLVLDALFRAEEEKAELRLFRDRYHQADKKNGIFEEKLKTNTAVDVISMGCMAAGGIAFGYSRGLWSTQLGTAIGAVVLGTILIFIGIIARAIRR